MKTKLAGVLQSAERPPASRCISLARVAGIAIVFSVLGFILSWHYDNPAIFWVAFGGTNLIIAIFLVVIYFIRKHEESLRFHLPMLLWVYGVMQLLLIVWEIFLK